LSALQCPCLKSDSRLHISARIGLRRPAEGEMAVLCWPVHQLCLHHHLSNCLSPDNSNSTCVYTPPSFALEQRHCNSQVNASVLLASQNKQSSCTYWTVEWRWYGTFCGTHSLLSFLHKKKAPRSGHRKKEHDPFLPKHLRSDYFAFWVPIKLTRCHFYSDTRLDYDSG